MKIRRFLEREPDVELLSDAASGTEAVERISQDRPDLVFLDVQMPGLDGFGVIEALEADVLPAIVFVTAYDQFALRAFEVHAIDYLLKPFDSERFKKAVEQSRRCINTDGLRSDAGLDDRLRKLLQEVQASQKFVGRLLVSSGDRVILVPVETIDWIESSRNYLKLHVGIEVYKLRGTIERLQSRLDPQKFLRVNRSQIVNLGSVKELQPWFHGEFRMLLKDGTELSWSRRFIDRSSTSVIGRL